MAEIPSFNRRHTPRHSVTAGSSYSHDAAVLLGARDRLDAVTIDVAPRSNSKTRHKPLALTTSSTLVKSVVHSSTANRKMSGSQLRLFFLFCVALYFTVICFADDIVRFAQWLGDDDVAAAWKAMVATTPPTAIVKATVEVWPRVEDEKRQGKEGVVTTKEPVREEEKKGGKATAVEEKKGNLRGGDDAANMTIPGGGGEKAELLTPAVLVQKGGDVKKGMEATPPPKTPEEIKSNGKVEPPQVTEAISPKTEEEKLVNRNNAKMANAQTTTSAKKEEGEVVHKATGDEIDAPLDSIEERETRVDTNASTEKLVTEPSVLPVSTGALALPAEIPKTPTQYRSTTKVDTRDVPATPQEMETAASTPVADDTDGARNPDAAR